MKNLSSPVFRTHKEMDKVYKTLTKRDLAGKPYILEYERGAQELIFFGSIHSGDPEHGQTVILDGKWHDFINSDNPKKHVFSEGNVRPVDGKTKEQAIRSHAESGQICWLAQEAGLPITSPEPERGEEISHLYERGLSYGQIITYYFARQMLQWINYDHQNEPDWRKYAGKVKLYQTVHGWGGLEINIDSILSVYKDQTGESFSIENKDALYNLSDPFQNLASAESSKFRDQKLYESIAAKWGGGYNIFVVYGSGHAIVLEPALRSLTGDVDG